MKKKLIVTILSLVLLLSFSPLNINSLGESTLFNKRQVKLEIDNKLISVDNIEYNNEIFIPLDDVAKMVGKEVNKDKNGNLTLETKLSDDVFRGLKFGMSKQQVNTTEKTATNFIELETLNMYSYEAYICSYNSTLFYQFNNSNQLCNVIFITKSDTSNQQIDEWNCLTAYSNINSELAKKFGNDYETTSDRISNLWNDNTEKAILYGQLRMYTVWDKDDYTVTTQIYGDDEYNIKISMTITSKRIDQYQTPSGL